MLSYMDEVIRAFLPRCISNKINFFVRKTLFWTGSYLLVLCLHFAAILRIAANSNPYFNLNQFITKILKLYSSGFTSIFLILNLGHLFLNKKLLSKLVNSFFCFDQLSIDYIGSSFKIEITQFQHVQEDQGTSELDKLLRTKMFCLETYKPE